MVQRRCPDTGQMIEFPAECEGCEFLKHVGGAAVCSYKIKPEEKKHVRK